MARRKPNSVDQHVVVPNLNQTGMTSAVSKTSCDVTVDSTGAVVQHNLADVFRLTWKDRGVLGSSFICVSKAWLGFRGRRKLRVQAHHIYNGRVGRRIILLEKVNGRIVYEG